MTDFNQWKINIFSSIRDLGDIKYQNESWLGKSTSFASSFGEDISILYDNFGFADDFWDEKNLKQFNLKPDLLEELRLLKEMIDLYKKKVKLTDEEILIDPEWLKITEQARKIIKCWEEKK